MSISKHIQMLTRYKAWANDALFQALSELPANELITQRQIVFGNILRTLNHILVIDLVWKAHLKHIPHEFTTRNPESTPLFSELREEQNNIDAWYVNYAGDLHPEALWEFVDFTFIGGGAGSMTRGDILFHVVNHATYHRGHIAAMIYQIPSHPPTTDLPVFFRENERA